MKIKIITQNIRGLNDPLAVDNLQNYIQKHPIDILFIQEHKLRGSTAANLSRQVWKHATTFYTEATPWYTTDGTTAGKGGVASFISPRWASYISRSGSLFDGRVHWFIMAKVPGGDLGFINLYAPTHHHPRRILWETISREIPNSCRWIMLGDYNMVERRADKSSLCGKTMPAQERLLFNALKTSIQVEEYPKTSPTLSYSWDNARRDGDRLMARLDRIYLFPDSPGSQRKILDYRIIGDNTKSDHNPIYLSLELAQTQP